MQWSSNSKLQNIGHIVDGRETAQGKENMQIIEVS